MTLVFFVRLNSDVSKHIVLIYHLFSDIFRLSKVF
jgi:hypothetical protein